MNLSAVLFDVGGTIAESEEVHRQAFNDAFKEFGLTWYWDEAIYRELLLIGGGKERITYYLKRAWPEMLKQKNITGYIESVHKIKVEIYQDYLNDFKLKARPGILRLIKELKKENIRLAIVSDTTEVNLKNLFKKGLNIDLDECFEVLAHGGCTIKKKPSPDIYLWALEKLRLPAEACIVIEDSPRGVESAINAGLGVIVTPSIYTKNESFKLGELIISDLGEPDEPFELIKGNNYEQNHVDYILLKKIHNNLERKVNKK